jgi:hypothetical protein
MSRAFRLRLAVEGQSVRLQSLRRVDALVPASDPIDVSDQSGFWVEVQDREGRTIYRRVLGNVMQDTIEVFSPDPNETVARRPRPPAQREFIVIVPDPGRGSSAALFGTPYERGRSLGSSREIARFEFDRELSAP